jgi:hypothetical protein
MFITGPGGAVGVMLYFGRGIIWYVISSCVVSWYGHVIVCHHGS